MIGIRQYLDFASKIVSVFPLPPGFFDAVGDLRVAQPGAQFVLDPAVVEPARFAHERELQRRHFERCGAARDARRARYAEAVGDEVEILPILS